MATTIIQEALSKKQIKTVDSYIKSGDGQIPQGHLASNEVYKNGEDTLRFPLDTSMAEIPINSKVSEHLQKHGYSIPDSATYKNGHCLSPKNVLTRIGGALGDTKAHPSVKSSYDNDPHRQSQGPLDVVITKNPYHVAGMSTDRGWTSCMNMVGGIENHHIQGDIIHGTHIAYLVHKHDTHINDPVARIALKPFKEIGGSHVILRPETKTYGTSTPAFNENVNHFCNTHFPMKDGAGYQPHADLYDDSERGQRKALVHPDKFLDRSEITSDNVPDILNSPAHRKLVFNNLDKITKSEHESLTHEYGEHNDMFTDAEAAKLIQSHIDRGFEHKVHTDVLLRQSVPVKSQIHMLHHGMVNTYGFINHDIHPDVANEVMKMQLSGEASGNLNVPEGADKELSMKLMQEKQSKENIFNNLTSADLKAKGLDHLIVKLPSATVADYVESQKRNDSHGNGFYIHSKEIAQHILNTDPAKSHLVSYANRSRMGNAINAQFISATAPHTTSKLFDYSKLKSSDAKEAYKKKYTEASNADTFSKRYMNQFFNIAERDNDHKTMEAMHGKIAKNYPLTDAESSGYSNRIQKIKGGV